MRESRFRGVRIYDKKWVYGNLIIDDNGEKHIVENELVFEDGHKIHIRNSVSKNASKDMCINTNIPIFFDQSSIGEFTGLTDKDDTDIYEHDIIRIGNRNLLFVVEWFQAGFVAKPIKTKPCKSDKVLYSSSPKSVREMLKEQQYIPLNNCEPIKVIGNTFEHMDLLQGYYLDVNLNIREKV